MASGLQVSCEPFLKERRKISHGENNEKKKARKKVTKRTNLRSPPIWPENMMVPRLRARGSFAFLGRFRSRGK